MPEHQIIVDEATLKILGGLARAEGMTYGEMVAELIRRDGHAVPDARIPAGVRRG